LYKIALFLFILIFFTACEKTQKHENRAVEQPTKKTEKPERTHFLLSDKNRTIELDLSGQNLSLKGTKDLVLVLFFTSWCPSCQAEMVEMEKLVKTYPDLDIVGLQLDSEKRVEKSFFISHNIKTNEAIAKKVYSLIHAPASMPIPVTVLLKRNEYVIHYIGAVPIEMLEIDIKKAKEG